MTTKSQPSLLTRNETAEISGVSTNAVNKAVEQRVVKPKRRRGRTLLVAEEAAALALLSEVSVRLSLKAKRELRNWIVQNSPGRAEEFELSPALRVAMTEYATEVAKHAAQYVRLRDKYIEVNPSKMGGTPVIRGTRVPVRTLARLVEGGESPKALSEDYPHIPEEAYEFAVRWAKGNPPRGRPTGSRHNRRGQGRQPRKRRTGGRRRKPAGRSATPA